MMEVSSNPNLKDFKDFKDLKETKITRYNHEQIKQQNKENWRLTASDNKQSETATWKYKTTEFWKEREKGDFS